MPTFLEALKNHEANNANYFMIAGEHPFACPCPHCVTFLGLTGLEAGDENGRIDPRWAELRDEMIDASTGWARPSQVERFMAIADDNL